MYDIAFQLEQFQSYERFCEGHFFAENPLTQALSIHKSKHRRENMKNVNIEHKKDFKAPSKLPPVTDADFTEKFKLY